MFKKIKRIDPTTSTCQESEFRLWCQTQTSFQIGEAYCANILGFIRKQQIPFDKGYAAIFDHLNVWHDHMHQSQYQLHSIANAYRYVFYYSNFLGLDQDVLEDLSERISSVQKSATREVFQYGVLDLMDPIQLNQIRNEIIVALRTRQREVIDRFISSCLQFPDNVSKEDLVNFGVNELRCWIEAVLRFANVPCRMQITQHMRMPSSSFRDFVSKLSVGSNQFLRLIFQDKVGKTAQPISIPCGPIISMYIMFYIKYCRPSPNKADVDFVFLSKMGAPWRNATKCVKSYFREELKLDINRLDPSGRIIHGARRVVLATYAIQCNFNEKKLQHMACLMRHSLETARTFYSPWVELYRARSASHAFADVMNVPDKLDMQVSCLNSAPIEHIGQMNRFCYRVLQETFAEYAQTLNRQGIRIAMRPQKIRQCVQFKDVACQTTQDSSIHYSKTAAHDKATISSSWVAECCPKHQDVLLQLHGPCGNKRNRYFGHYFVQCVKCHPNKRLLPNVAKILPLSWSPPVHIKSVSSKPRNMKEIIAFRNYGQRKAV